MCFIHFVKDILMISVKLGITNKCMISRNIFVHTAVWKSTIKHDHDFFGKINQQHLFRSVKSTKEITKKLISRKFLSVIAFYSTGLKEIINTTEKK